MQEAPPEERANAFRLGAELKLDPASCWSNNKISVSNLSGGDIVVSMKIIPDVFLIHPVYGAWLGKIPSGDLQQISMRLKQVLFPDGPEIVRPMPASDESVVVFSLGPLSSFAFVRAVCKEDTLFDNLVPAGKYGLTIRSRSYFTRHISL